MLPINHDIILYINKLSISTQSRLHPFCRPKIPLHHVLILILPLLFGFFRIQCRLQPFLLLLVLLCRKLKAKPNHDACYHDDYDKKYNLPKTTPAAKTAMNQGELKAYSAIVAWHIKPVLLNFFSFLQEHLPSSILSSASYISEQLIRHLN